MDFEWLGDEIVAKTMVASKVAIDTTTSECVVYAKQNHPWENETGTAEGSIQSRGAELDGGRMVGLWGSFTVDYFICLELGTVNMPAYPILFPTTDAIYPGLRRHLVEAMAI